MTAPLTDRSPFVVTTRFPARVSLEDGTVIAPRALVILSTDPELGPEFWVWERNGPEPSLHEQWVPQGSRIPRGGEGRWLIVTTGGVFVVAGGRGCAGCSRLGRYKPFHPWRYGRGMPAGVERRAEG